MTPPLLTSSTPTGCISDLQFDKWRAGELSGPRERELDLHLATCARCSQKQQLRTAEAARFLEQFPDPPRAASRPARLARKRAYWLGAASTGLAAAAALVLWLQAPGVDFGTRSKGAAHVSLFVKHAGEVTPGLAGQRVFAGDQLRFTVTTSKPQQLAILGRDGTGATFVYHPASDRSAAVGPGRDIALASSIELDTAPGTETIWAVFCDEAFAVGPLQASLTASGTLRQLPGCSIDSFQLVKGSQP